MTDPDPEFDAVHPSGHVVFRSSRGGYLHSVGLAEPAMDSDAETLAHAVMLTAEVSYLRALVRVREDMVQNGHAPSADVPTRDDLDTAVDALLRHRLRRQG